MCLNQPPFSGTGEISSGLRTAVYFGVEHASTRTRTHTFRNSHRVPESHKGTCVHGNTHCESVKSLERDKRKEGGGIQAHTHRSERRDDLQTAVAL